MGRAASLSFTIPRRSQGKLLLDFPRGVAELSGATEGSAHISAIQLYQRRPLRPAQLDPIPEEPAAGETRVAAARSEDEE